MLYSVIRLINYFIKILLFNYLDISWYYWIKIGKVISNIIIIDKLMILLK